MRAVPAALGVCLGLAFRDCSTDSTEHPEAQEGWEGAANCGSLVLPPPHPSWRAEMEFHIPSHCWEPSFGNGMGGRAGNGQGSVCGVTQFISVQ